MSTSAPCGDHLCPRCFSIPCRCFGTTPQPQPLPPYIDPFVLIRIAVALERISDALAGEGQNG